jgi:hypothetical protein
MNGKRGLAKVHLKLHSFAKICRLRKAARVYDIFHSFDFA